MKKFILLFLLFAGVSAYAQKNNDYYKINLAEKPNEQNQLLFFKVNPKSINIVFFWIDYEIKDIDPRKLDMAKSGFILKLGNDSTLTFKVDTTVSSSINTDRGEILTLVALITKDEIKSIHNNPAKNIQLFFNEKVFDVKTLTTKQQDQLKTYTDLLLKD